MLIRCSECDLQVSDKAIACPHCGCPLQPDTKQKPTRKYNRRRRLPNGFGQISEIKGRNLRNPFRAMVTVGKNENGRPICKPLTPQSFFPTYNDAYAALVEYNKNPYELAKSMTVKELYERWSESHFKKLTADSSIRTIESAWSYCSAIYDMNVSDLRARHVKGCMNEGTAIVKGVEKSVPVSVRRRIKSLFNNMMDYALEYELIDKNYARNFNTSDEVTKSDRKVKKEHIPFTDKEMEILWEHVDNMLYVDVVLIQAYSGWRPRELGRLKLEEVDLKKWTFAGGMKTDAGQDRIVPIHSRVRHLVERKYNQAKSLGSEYLINCIDAKDDENNLYMDYDKYRARFARIRKNLKLDPNHRTHDPRMHFVTMAKKYKVDEYAIKYMVGHAITDITEKVYTRRDVEWLKEEIEKIK